MPKSVTSVDTALRRVVRLVALLNFAYFGVEFTVAHVIGSVSLFAGMTPSPTLPSSALGW